MTRVPTVLFLCVHNAGRSQMAAAFLEKAAARRVRVLSAGSAPGERVNPVAALAMAEIGIDISAKAPRGVSDDDARAADVIVTMGCGDACPVYPGTRVEDWPVDDPAGRDLATVRGIRDDIASRVASLLERLGSG